jgi:hypothetical protein
MFGIIFEQKTFTLPSRIRKTLFVKIPHNFLKISLNGMIVC